MFEVSLSESRIYKKWQTSAIIWEISDSNIWRPAETVQNLESPGLSGRVDSPEFGGLKVYFKEGKMPHLPLTLTQSGSKMCLIKLPVYKC